MKQYYQLWYPSFDEERYAYYLKLFRLDEKRPLAQFSKGMKRQAFIIFALAIAPKLLLLDEVFDGLDPMMRLTFPESAGPLCGGKEDDRAHLLAQHP